MANLISFHFYYQFLILLLLNLVISFSSNAQEYIWAKGFSGNQFTSPSLSKVAIDGLGNVYSTGNFQQVSDFDPSSSVASLTSAGGTDVFISKLDSSGNYVWAKRIGGTGFDYASSVAVDSQGNIYVSGRFSGTVDFDPGVDVTTITSSGSTDIFVCKLDITGSFVWAKRIGGTGFDVCNDLVVDAANNVYTIGYFEETVDFDPGGGVASLTSAGAADIFISKLDGSGNYVWAKRMGGAGSDNFASSIVIDPGGNIYAAGSYQGIADFDSGIGSTILTSSGGYDIFVGKYDNAGNCIWAKSMNGPGDEYAYSVGIDRLGNVYSIGRFNQTVDFDPGMGTVNLTSAGSWDIFISKLDGSGNYVWSKRFGNVGNDFGNSLTVDASGNVYSTGRFSGTVDFDPGPNTSNLTATGSIDMFIGKLDVDGNYVSAVRIGGPSSNDSAFGQSILIKTSTIYTGGGFGGTVDFDPSPNVANLSFNGAGGAFVSKLQQSPLPISVTASTTIACVNNVISLTATAAGATAFNWTIPIGAVANNPVTGAFLSATLTTSGVNTFTVTASDGVNQSTATIAITVGIYSVQNGPWSSSSTWSCGRPPSVSDFVTVRHRVLIPANNSQVARKIIYEAGGNLSFEPEAKLRIFP